MKSKTSLNSLMVLIDNGLQCYSYDRFLAMIQVCDFSFNKYLVKQQFDDNLVHLLQEMAPPFEELFLMCIWRGKYVNCSDLFEPTLTERGICYTFNGLGADDILRKEEYHQDFEHLGEKRSSENWSMEHGYRPNIGLKAYPRRVASPGSTAGLFVGLKSELSDMDYLCGVSLTLTSMLVRSLLTKRSTSRTHFRDINRNSTPQTNVHRSQTKTFAFR